MDRETLVATIDTEERKTEEYELPDWMMTLKVLDLLTNDGAMGQLRDLTNNGAEPSAFSSLMTKHRFEDLLRTAEDFINHQLRGERLVALFPSPKSLSIEEQHVRYAALIEAAQACGVVDVIEGEVSGARQIKVVSRV